jgi:NADPH-ferrihemoprotein reductase
LPLSVALTEILRPTTVRYYSISSSSIESPTQISVTAVLVRYAIPQKSLNLSNTKKPRVVVKEGFATGWLERVHEMRESNPLHGTTNTTPLLHVPLYIRSSNFRLPQNQDIPVIMIGPGTGVAPFRGFVRERVILASNGKVGDTWLFTGSRHENSVLSFLL